MANCERTETLALLGRVVGAEFGWVKVLLVAAFSIVLQVSATHLVAAFWGMWLDVNWTEWLKCDFEDESLEGRSEDK